MENKTNIPEEKLNELHNKLMETVINFFKENGLPEDSFKISFDADGIKHSVEFGSWHPGTDSGLTLWNDKNECLFWSM